MVVHTAAHGQALNAGLISSGACCWQILQERLHAEGGQLPLELQEHLHTNWWFREQPAAKH